MPATQITFTSVSTTKVLCVAAIGYQGKEVNNRQDDIRCWSRRVRLCFLEYLSYASCFLVVKDC